MQLTTKQAQGIAVAGAVVTSIAVGSVLYTKASIVALAWVGLIAIAGTAGAVEGFVVEARLNKNKAV